MTTAFRADTTHVEMGDGKFDSRNRYIRKVANSGDKTLNISRGKTIEIHTQAVGSSGSTAVAWRWQCGAATVTAKDRNANAFNVSVPASFNNGIDAAI